MGILRDIKDQAQKETAYGIIQFLINDEQEAIDGYLKSIEKLKYIDMPYEKYKSTVELLNHIIDEEKEHIEELNSLKFEEEI